MQKRDQNKKNVFYIYVTNLPAGEHVRDVICNCAQSLHARAFQFGQKKFRFDSIRQSDKFAACTLIFK